MSAARASDREAEEASLLPDAAPPSPGSSAPPRYSIALGDPPADPPAEPVAPAASSSSAPGPIDAELRAFTHDVDALFSHIDSLRGTPAEKLPTYTEAVSAPATAVRLGDGTTVVQSSAAGVAVQHNPFVTYERTYGEEEVYVEGWVVGSWVVFLLNCVASTAFDFIGFVLTFFLATSHAAREGARAGLGVTLVRYGLYVHDHAGDPEMDGRWREDYAMGRNGTAAEGDADGDNQAPAGNATAPAANATAAGELEMHPANWTSLGNGTLAPEGTVRISDALNGTANATFPLLNATSPSPLNSTDSLNLTLPSAPTLPAPLFARQQPAPSDVEFTSYTGLFMMVLGWVLIFRAVVAFARVRRMEAVQLPPDAGARGSEEVGEGQPRDEEAQGEGRARWLLRREV
ncbi:hypothetical protein DFJ74DRAFT_143527 [Hyaloraphidium curvatum]|nr:hypothetical protein DFJ74DRAFT_143527 [Hyaloraphidium curvatum]